MKIKRWIAGILNFGICLSLAWATESGTSFTDVPPGSWFEDGVALCVGNGVMLGTGEGMFSPEAELTGAECLTLALRLYDVIQCGGDGDFLSAPEEWGKLTLTTEEGTIYTNHGTAAWKFDLPNNSFAYQTKFDIAVVLSESSEAIESQKTVTYSSERATLTMGKETIFGTVSTVTTPWQELLAFCAEKPLPEEWLNAVRYPIPGMWWRNAVYTTRQWDLYNGDNMGFVLLSTGNFTEAVPRGLFALAIADAVGNLPVLKEEVAIPDEIPASWSEAVLKLYQAGILNGIDETGTFAPNKELTRAEAAVIVARVLDSALRVSSTEKSGQYSVEPTGNA